MAKQPKDAGSVALIGAGPGDPSLITVRACDRLRAADLVLYDALAHPRLLDYCRPDAELVFVGKRAGRASERQESINHRLVEAARAGKRVVRLKGGDPYLFGRGSEEAEILAREGIEFEVVPGIPSPLAATAYAGISLTHRDLASSVAYLTATESPGKDRTSHEWSKLATATQTLVIFMGMRRLDSLMRLLMDHGRPPQTPVAVISRASLPDQRTVVGTVSDIAERVKQAALPMPALTVVGDVVKLRRQLRWFDTLPLFGKRVLVTRPAEQSDGLARLLRERGAEAVELPTIRIAPPDDDAPLREAVSELGRYTWVIFTSANGVRAFFDAVHALGKDSRALGSARVAAIGPATAAALTAHGIVADVVPDEYRGEAVAEAITQHPGQLGGTRVLLARAAVAREALPDMLRQAGAEVDVVPAYTTLGPDEWTRAQLTDALQQGKLDVATFTSSSTVSRLLEDLDDSGKRALASVTLAAIGPITAQTLRDAGLPPQVVAEEYTSEGLVEALQDHFASQRQGEP